MHMQNVPLLVALVASIVLILRVRPRLFPAIALVASGVEVLRGLGALSFRVPVIGAGVLFGGLLVVAGLGSWTKSNNKVATSAATVVILTGLLRALARFL